MKNKATETRSVRPSYEIETETKKQLKASRPTMQFMATVLRGPISSADVDEPIIQ